MNSKTWRHEMTSKIVTLCNIFVKYDVLFNSKIWRHEKVVTNQSNFNDVIKILVNHNVTYFIKSYFLQFKAKNDIKKSMTPLKTLIKAFTPF